MAQPEEYTFRWKVRKGEYGDVCCSVSGFIKHRAQTVGTLEGTLIARGVNAYNSGLRFAGVPFVVMADEISSELEQIASVIFDGDTGVVRHPRLRRSLPLACSFGGFLHVAKIIVDPNHRGRDLALKALKSLFDHLNGRWTLAVLCPGVAGPALREEQDAYERASEEEKKVLEAKRAIAVDKIANHYARIGFKQLGKREPDSGFMFLESTAVRDFSRGAAASAAVPAAAPFFWRPDAEPLTPADVLAASAVQALKGKPAPALPELRAELQAAVAAGASLKRARVLHCAATAGVPAAVYRLLLELDPSLSINDIDPVAGAAPIHIAAAAVVEAGGSLAVRDDDGCLPYEAAYTATTSSVDINWVVRPLGPPGPARYVTFLSLMPPDVRAACVGGWLSPRMHFRLLACAEIMGDMFRDDFASHRWQNYQPELDFENLTGLGMFPLEHVPAALRQGGVYKSFAGGFLNCLDAAAGVLRRGEAPTVAAVTRELHARGDFDQRYTRFFLEKGGRVEHALDAVLTRSEEESEDRGDGTFNWVFAEPDAAHPSGTESDCDETLDFKSVRYLPWMVHDGDYDLVRALVVPEGSQSGLERFRAPEGRYFGGGGFGAGGVGGGGWDEDMGSGEGEEEDEDEDEKDEEHWY